MTLCWCDIKPKFTHSLKIKDEIIRKIPFGIAKTCNKSEVVIALCVLNSKNLL